MESILRAREQLGDPAHRRGVHGESPLGREPGQVMRPAGLRTGAGEALAAEGLHAHHRSDHAAVDVDVADEIGRASCRERVWISVGAWGWKKKKKNYTNNQQM